MYRRTQRGTQRAGRTDSVARLGHVLAGLAYPAAKWQIVVHADHYGADAVSTTQLWSLPPGTYADLAAVCQALGVLPVRRQAPQPRERAE